MNTTSPYPDFYTELLVWLTGDREVRSFKVHVTADDPAWPEELDDPTDDDAIWTYDYAIEATDVHVWGLEDDQANEMTSMTFHGHGASLNEAAGHVLAAIKDSQFPIGDE